MIAGGQSLMPVLAFRLATPSMLVDLRRVPGLGDIAIDDSGVRLGARVRWRDIEDDRRLADRASAAAGGDRPCRALPDPQPRHRRRQPRPCRPGRRTARHRGDLRCRNHPRRRRRNANACRAGEFFTGPLSTLRQARRDHHRAAPAVLAAGIGAGPFRNSPSGRAISRSPASPCFTTRIRTARVNNAHVGVIGACHRPHRLTEVEAVLNGRVIDDDLIRAPRRRRRRDGRSAGRSACRRRPIAAVLSRRSPSAVLRAAAQARSA